LVQLVTYLPPIYILHDFQRTSHRRGGAHFFSYFTETLPTLGTRLQNINSPALNFMLAWALATSLVILLRARRGDRPQNPAATVRLELSRLFVALIVGAVASSAVLTDYFTDAFFGSQLPFIIFFNATAMAIAASDLFAVMARLPLRRTRLRVIAALVASGLVIMPMVRQSLQWWRDYPGLSGGYIDILKKHYHKKPILVMSHFTYDPTAITRGQALWMTGEESDIAKAGFPQFEQFRDEKGELVFLCLYLRWVEGPKLVRHLEASGEEILYEGRDFAFVGLKRRPQPPLPAAKGAEAGRPASP
jgi:hypothetical protein